MALLAALAARAMRRSETLCEDALARVEAGVAAIGGVRAERDGSRVVLTGAGLRKRLLGDARLRFLSGRRG